jgi:hypothetical protein
VSESVRESVSESVGESVSNEGRWAALASYAVGTFLRGHGLEQGARLGIARRWRPVHIAVGYGLFPATQVSGHDVVLTVKRHPVDVALGYASDEHYRMRWSAEAVMTGDWMARHTDSATAPLAARADASHFLLSLGARGRQDLRILRNVALSLAVGLDVPLNPVAFHVARGTTSETVARLSPVRFSAELGLTLSAF